MKEKDFDTIRQSLRHGWIPDIPDKRDLRYKALRMSAIAAAIVIGVLLLSDKTAKKAASEAAIEVIQEMAKQKLVQTQGESK